MSNYKYEKVMQRVRQAVGSDPRFGGLAFDYQVLLRTSGPGPDATTAVVDLNDLCQCELDGRLDERIGSTLDAMARHLNLENPRAQEETDTT